MTKSAVNGNPENTPLEAKPRRGALVRLWELAVSPVTFVVLSVLWCLDLGIGSIVAYRKDPQFWVKMDAYPFNVWLERVAPQEMPQSLWVYVLVALTYLVVASLLLCTLNWFFRRRKWMRGMGEVLVHLGFLLVFVGYVLGSGFGARTQGVQVSVEGMARVDDQGIALRVDEVEVMRGPGGRAWDTVSRVSVLVGEEEVASGKVSTNHPLIWGSTVIYPQGYQTRVLGGTVATGEGVVSLGPGEDAVFSSGRRLSVLGVLSPGERGGPYFGPGMLVALWDLGGQRLGTVFLSPGMRGVADLAGLKVRLVDLRIEPSGVYNVHRDPGVWFVLLGAVALSLGSLWALAGYLGLLPARPALPDDYQGPQEASSRRS